MLAAPIFAIGIIAILANELSKMDEVNRIGALKYASENVPAISTDAYNISPALEQNPRLGGVMHQSRLLGDPCHSPTIFMSATDGNGNETLETKSATDGQIKNRTADIIDQRLLQAALVPTAIFTFVYFFKQRA